MWKSFNEYLKDMSWVVFNKCKDTNAMISTINRNYVFQIYILFAKTCNFYPIPKPFPSLKFVSKSLSFCLMMSTSVGRSMQEGNRWRIQEVVVTSITSDSWRHVQYIEVWSNWHSSKWWRRARDAISRELSRAPPYLGQPQGACSHEYAKFWILKIGPKLREIWPKT